MVEPYFGSTIPLLLRIEQQRIYHISNSRYVLCPSCVCGGPHLASKRTTREKWLFKINRNLPTLLFGARVIVLEQYWAVIGLVVGGGPLCHVMSDCLPHFLWQQSIAAPQQSASVRPSVRRRHEQKKEGNRPNKTLFIVAAVGRSVGRSVAPPFLSTPLPSKANKEVKGVDGPPLSPSLFFLSLAIGSKCYFGREKVPCAARQAKHSGTSSSLGGRTVAVSILFVAAPFSAQSDILRPCPCSISYRRALPGLDPVLSHSYMRQAGGL